MNYLVGIGVLIIALSILGLIFLAWRISVKLDRLQESIDDANKQKDAMQVLLPERLPGSLQNAPAEETSPLKVVAASTFEATGDHPKRKFDGYPVGEVKELIKLLIEGEDKRKPLADTELQQELKAMGFQVARRAVTKKRIELGIPASRHRRRWDEDLIAV